MPHADLSSKPFDTHRVDNQPPEFGPCDLWHTDVALREAVMREGGGEIGTPTIQKIPTNRWPLL